MQQFRAESKLAGVKAHSSQLKTTEPSSKVSLMLAVLLKPFRYNVLIESIDNWRAFPLP